MGLEWYSNPMKVTIDTAGRLVVPKAAREQLGFAAGMELDLDVVDGRLEVSAPSRVRVEDGPHGVRFTAEHTEALGSERVRAIVERGRR